MQRAMGNPSMIRTSRTTKMAAVIIGKGSSATPKAWLEDRCAWGASRLRRDSRSASLEAKEKMGFALRAKPDPRLTLKA